MSYIFPIRFSPLGDTRQKGFTLVELAIVLMIIGLLIGGILKGQELIQNARITTSIAQLKSYGAAVITFEDSYGQKPGDITSPSTRLPNCTTGMCVTAGDGNGVIGTQYVDNENNAMWIHLAAGGLVSGIDMNSSWTGGTMYAASVGSFKLGRNVSIRYRNNAANATYPDGLIGYYWIPYVPNAGGTDSEYNIPVDILAKLDTKMDDGKPCIGSVKLTTYCSSNPGATAYDPNDKTPSSTAWIKADF